MVSILVGTDDESRVDAVRIGEVAALYDLSPSTIRWWEREGVIEQPPRASGQRAYSELDLRRIGLAYLCCVVGKLPLKSAAVVVSDSTSFDERQEAIIEQIERFDAEIDAIREARDYLALLLRCSREDFVRCPYLDHELIERTPRGRIPAEDLITAALEAFEAESERRDDSERLPGAEQAGSPPIVSRCVVCNEPLTDQTRGRRPIYCSRACQQRAYRARQTSGRFLTTGIDTLPAARTTA